MSETKARQLEAAAARLLEGMGEHVRELMSQALDTEALGLIQLAVDALEKHGTGGYGVEFDRWVDYDQTPYIGVGNHIITPDFAVRGAWKIIATFDTFDEAYRVALEVTA